MTNENSDQTRISSDDFRKGMRHWATGVTIVTSYEKGSRHGMTVSSFTSISVDPPIVMVALGKDTRTHKMVSDSGHFAVTILERAQEKISNRFAGQEASEKDRFEGLDTFNLVTGCPLLTDGLSFFDCVVKDKHLVGTNTVFYGEVVAVQINQNRLDNDPLVYFNQKYRNVR